MADISSSLPVTDRADGTDGAAAPSLAIQIAGKDGSGNLQALLTDTAGQVMMEDIANVSVTYAAVSVSTTAVLMSVSGTNMVNRKLLTLQPTNGIIYIGSNSSVTTTTGTPIYSTQTLSFAVGPAITVYAIATVATNVRIIEGS